MSKEKETFRLGNLPGELIERGRDLWLAGLGAVATVEKEGSELIETLEKQGDRILSDLQKEANAFFKDLVKRGEQTEKKGRKRLTAVVGEVEERQKEVTGKLESLVSETVEATLGRLDIPTRREVQTLTKKVDALMKQVDALTALMQGRGETEAEKAWTVYLVKALDEGWAVLREGEDRPLSVHETKVEAVDAARERAKAQEPSKLVIYRKDGSVQDTNTYGG
jgi:poly(hydroxyalkanoate) granule-associated protein